MVELYLMLEMRETGRKGSEMKRKRGQETITGGGNSNENKL